MVERKRGASPPAAAEAAPRETAGDRLRAARLARNLRIEDVSAALRIRAAQIQAIEDNDPRGLPGMTYAAGFVRSYANFVGLNADDMVTLFKSDNGAALTQTLVFPAPLNESRHPSRATVRLAAGTALVLVLGWAAYTHIARGPDAADIPPVAAETVETPAEATLPAPPMTEPPAAPASAVEQKPAEPATPPQTAAEPVAPETPVAAAAPAPAPVAEMPVPPADIPVQKPRARIVLRAAQDSWIEVTRGGATLYKKVLRAGEEYRVPEGGAASLVTTNAGGLEVVIDGKKTRALGAPGEIVRGITLEAPR